MRAFVSWFSWDPAQEWVNSPGLFWDRLSSRFDRITQTILCFVLLEIAFVPAVQQWGVGEFRSVAWLWKANYDFFSNLFLPVAMLICVLVSTGARPLWLHLEVIEWCKVSEEFE